MVLLNNNLPAELDLYDQLVLKAGSPVLWLQVSDSVTVVDKLSHCIRFQHANNPP